jgi:hypothetical protein
MLIVHLLTLIWFRERKKAPQPEGHEASFACYGCCLPLLRLGAYIALLFGVWCLLFVTGGV